MNDRIIEYIILSENEYEYIQYIDTECVLNTITFVYIFISMESWLTTLKYTLILVVHEEQ